MAGAGADPYFDFSTISAADVLKVGERFYMTYEGIRGPGPGDGGDTQFNLGFARSTTNEIDGKWEKFSGNPHASRGGRRAKGIRRLCPDCRSFDARLEEELHGRGVRITRKTRASASAPR